MRMFSVATILTALFLSCSPSGDEPSFLERQRITIDSLENVLSSAEGELNEELGKRMVETYVVYADSFPADTLSPVYLFRAGDVARNLDGMEYYAIAYYVRVFQDYPEYSRAAEALFMTGITFDDAGDKERAAKTFEHFLATYPDHPWKNEAADMLRLARDTVELGDQVDAWLESSRKEEKQ